MCYVMVPTLPAHPSSPPPLGNRVARQPRTGFTDGAGRGRWDGSSLEAVLSGFHNEIPQMHGKSDGRFRFQ